MCYYAWLCYVIVYVAIVVVFVDMSCPARDAARRAESRARVDHWYDSA